MTALARTFPGQRIYVPWSNAEAMDRFAENFVPLIGKRAVAKLFEDFGGLRIIVPTLRKPKRGGGRGTVPVSMELVIELTEAGLSAKDIAKILKCDPRTVHMTRTKARGLGRLKRARRKRKGAR